MRKRLAVIGIAGVMAASLLAGCSSSGETDTQSSTSDSSQAVSDASANAESAQDSSSASDPEQAGRKTGLGYITHPREK